MGILYLISVNLSKNIPYVGALYNIQCIYNVYVSWWQYPDPDHQISHAKYDVSHHHKTLQKVEPSTRELWSHHDHDDHHQGVMIPPWSIDHDDHHQGVMVPPTSWRGDNECSSWPPQFPGSFTSAKVSIFVVFFIIFFLVQRVVKMFVAVVLVFAFSWLPYHLFFLLSYHFPQVSVVFRLLHSFIRICKSPWEIWLWWWQKWPMATAHSTNTGIGLT